MRCSACRLLLERSSSEGLLSARFAARFPPNGTLSRLITQPGGTGPPKTGPAATLPPSSVRPSPVSSGGSCPGSCPARHPGIRHGIPRFLSGTASPRGTASFVRHGIPRGIPFVRHGIPASSASRLSGKASRHPKPASAHSAARSPRIGTLSTLASGPSARVEALLPGEVHGQLPPTNRSRRGWTLRHFVH